MNRINAGFFIVLALGGTTLAMGQGNPTIAIGPLRFEQGNTTSRETAFDSLRKIAEHKGYTVLAQAVTQSKYDGLHPAMAYRKGLPINSDLARYARSLHASKLLFGSVNWHTRSIWVGAGPKTISTAKVDLYLYDAATGRISFKKTGVEGRSDEKEQTLKVVLDVLVTPLVSVVSGGPATPREQGAVQIALGRALVDLK